MDLKLQFLNFNSETNSLKDKDTKTRGKTEYIMS